MRRWFILLFSLLLANAALAEPAITQLAAPETPQQRRLLEISSGQAERTIANMLALRADDLELAHDAKLINDGLYDFVIGAEGGLPKPVSVVIMLPAESFAERGPGGEANPDISAVPVDYFMNAALLTNYNANLERDQAIFLEYNSAIQAVEAWRGRGIAFVLRTYGAGKPQIVTAVALSEDTPWAVAKTTVVCFRQIAERRDALISLITGYAGPEEYDIIVIKEAQTTE